MGRYVSLDTIENNKSPLLVHNNICMVHGINMAWF